MRCNAVFQALCGNEANWLLTATKDEDGLRSTRSVHACNYHAQSAVSKLKDQGYDVVLKDAYADKEAPIPALDAALDGLNVAEGLKELRKLAKALLDVGATPIEVMGAAVAGLSAP